MASSQTADENLTKMHSSLQELLRNLQTKSDHHSSTGQTTPITPSFHTFFLTPLPLLLTPWKPHAIHELRIAYLRVTYLSSSAEESVKQRYNNFCSALLWALDHAEYLMQSGEASQVEIMKAIASIFHLVASLCHREWGIEQPSTAHNHQLDHATPSGAVPSIDDPVYHPPRRIKSSSAPHALGSRIATEHANQMPQIGTNLHPDDNIISLDTSCSPLHDGTHVTESQLVLNGLGSDHVCHTSQNTNTALTNNAPLNDSALQIDNTKQVPHLSNLIRNMGENVLPEACITEAADSCHIPFQFVVEKKHKSDVHGIYSLFNVGVLYPDNTHFPCIPIQDIHVLNQQITTKEATLKVIVDMSSTIFKAILDGLKSAYMAKFPRCRNAFLISDDTKLLALDSRVKIEIPVSSDCFATLVYLIWCVEHPLFEALELCQHDIMGCGLLQASFVETSQVTRIVLSLAGLVIDENTSNQGENICKLLSSGVLNKL